jgi:hypothetical protein
MEKGSPSASHSGSPVPPTSGSQLSPCCQTSAKRYLKRHRDVATCDACKRLLLAYGNDRDYDETRKALTEQGIAFAAATQGALRVIAKPRASQLKRGT